MTTLLNFLYGQLSFTLSPHTRPPGWYILDATTSLRCCVNYSTGWKPERTEFKLAACPRVRGSTAVTCRRAATSQPTPSLYSVLRCAGPISQPSVTRFPGCGSRLACVEYSATIRRFPPLYFLFAAMPVCNAFHALQRAAAPIWANVQHPRKCPCGGNVIFGHNRLFLLSCLLVYNYLLVQADLLTYLDLVPPVPDGTLGDEISPPVSIVGSSPCTMPS